MTPESSSRIALGLALPFAVNAVPPIIAKETEDETPESASVGRENQWATLLDCASRFIFSPLLLLRRSGCRDCVFPSAGVLQPTIGGAGGLAGARPFNALHLPGAACNLIRILACLKCAIFHRPGGLVGVENLVPAVKRFHEHARDFTVVS